MRAARLALASALLATAITARPVEAQGAPATEFRAALLTDLEAMRGKFVGLAEAFPQDKYEWRPMDGVRSVAEVLMLSAFEGYSFIPTSFGGKAADVGPREEMQKMRTLTDKAQVIAHINKGFAHARAQIESIDPAVLGASRNLFGKSRSANEIALFVFGDLHEHLGQMIAYARMNHIVPPWSK